MAKYKQKSTYKPRVGPAGKGKYQTQIHGDTKYNRLKNKQDTQQVINDQIGGVEKIILDRIKND